MPRTDNNFFPQKESLMRIALDVFAKNGYENVTMSQLQAAFGLSRGGMYHYFSSKEEILDSVIKYAIEKDAEDILKRLETVPLEQKLMFMIKDETLDDFSQKLLFYKRDNRSSLLAYKLREANIKAVIKLTEDIFCQSVLAGFYKTEYPKEMAAFTVLIFFSILEPGVLPAADSVARRKSVEVFYNIFVTQLQAPREHTEEIKQYMLQVIETQEERSHG